jgi:hypothetical protein
LARQIGRPDPSSQARAQLVLVALAAWDLITFIAELVRSSLLEVASDGALGGRAFAGTTLVLAIAYLYAARDPMRNRFVLWIASLEQVIGLFSMAFHWARDDTTTGDVWLPMLASAVFLALLIGTLPRQTATMRA